MTLDPPWPWPQRVLWVFGIAVIMGYIIGYTASFLASMVSALLK